MFDEAAVYKALWDVGRMSPRDVDDLMIWEIAVLLGASQELNEGKVEERPQSYQERSMELIRQRVAYAQGLGPKPEARPVDPVAFQALVGSLR